MKSRLLVVLAAGLALAAGCARPPSLHYRADLRDLAAGVLVTVRVDGAPRDSFALESDAPIARAPISGVTAVAPGGGELAATVSTVRRDGDESAIDCARVRVAGPLPASFTVTYRVALGAREGNAHTGFTGERASVAGAGYAFAPGSVLFMVPRDRSAVGEIDVMFDLPEDWTVRAPWEPAGAGWKPEVRGGRAIDGLLRAGIGFGQFETSEVARHGTRFEYAVESSIPPATRDSVLAALDSLAASVTDAFGRGLGARYLTVVMPEVPGGDQLIRQGWATGAGGTFAPLTTARAFGQAQGLVEAYLADAPTRSVVREPKERWLAGALMRLLPWRALERAGMSGPEDYTRRLATDYARDAEESDSTDIEWNLERLASTDKDPTLAREVLAPLALLRIELQARLASGGREGLSDVLHRVFAKPVAGSLWNALPQPGDLRWERLRARYVRGEAGFIDDPIFAQQAPAEYPSPARGEPVHKLAIAVTGNTYGYLENCGCVAGQAGGLARRATMLGRLRAQNPLLVIDAGNALERADHYVERDFLTGEEQRVLLETMRSMGYSIGAVGPAELAQGPAAFRDVAKRTRFPFVIANASDSAGPLAPASKIVTTGGIRIGVIGLMEPGRGPWASDALERRAGAAVAFADPETTLARLLPPMRKRADLVAVMGSLSPATIRRLVSVFPDLDLVVSCDDEAGTIIRDDDTRRISGSDDSGFIGQTLVLYASMATYGVSGAVIQLDSRRRIASADAFAHYLGDSIPDDRRVRDRLTRFYASVGRTAAAQASVSPPFAADPERMRGDYVGADRCAGCHATEFAQWKTTPHAEAWKTLLDAHRHFQPRCVACHVVGFGAPSGYRMGAVGERLVNVQCEVCHGPGGRHVTAPARGSIRRDVPEAVCLQCHTPDHSDHFVYADRLPRVVHQGPRVIDATGPPTGH